MDCHQDLALNTLTVLDNSSEASILCIGDAIFKKSIKIHENIHLYNNLMTSGSIIPLNQTETIGIPNNQWLNIHSAEGNFSTINVDTINVKNINTLPKKEYTYIQIKNEDEIIIDDGLEYNIFIYNLTNATSNTINIILQTNDPINDQIKIVIINPNRKNININKISSKKIHQIYDFLYINDSTLLNKWILIYQNI